MKKLRIYLDTSIINHLDADDARKLMEWTIDFFENYVQKHKYNVYISPIVINEIEKTKNDKRREQLLGYVRKYSLEIIDIDSIQKEVEELASVYIEKEIIPEKKIEDALHIAITTILEFDVLLSWNYKHLANLNKEMQIHAINLTEGYTKVFRMTTPLEVISDEE